MWRPNPKHSKEVMFRCLTFDNDNTDDYGNPKATFVDTSKVVEIYPYSNVVKREAIGLTNEQAFIVIVDHIALKSHDVVIIDNMVYRINFIDSYDPIQLVIVNTNQTTEQYTPQEA